MYCPYQSRQIVRSLRKTVTIVRSAWFYYKSQLGSVGFEHIQKCLSSRSLLSNLYSPYLKMNQAIAFLETELQQASTSI